MDNFDLKKFLTENKLTNQTRLQEADFLQGDTITFRYAGYTETPGTEGGGFLEYVTTQPIAGRNLVIRLGGNPTQDSQGNVVDFEHNFDYDENLEISLAK
jgi:hypothetical protein